MKNDEGGAMAVMHGDPFAGFDRMFDMVYGRQERGRRTMPIDIFRNGDEYTVEMDLPGVDPSTIDVNIERNMLTVTAESRSSHEDADEQVLCERSHARFSRQVYLGDNLDIENVNAGYENGVLRIAIPVAERQKARHIEVTKTSNGERAIDAQSTPTDQQSKQQAKQQ